MVLAAPFADPCIKRGCARSKAGKYLLKILQSSRIACELMLSSFFIISDVK